MNKYLFYTMTFLSLISLTLHAEDSLERTLGQMISEGLEPYTDSWEEMQKRDLKNQTKTVFIPAPGKIKKNLNKKPKKESISSSQNTEINAPIASTPINVKTTFKGVSLNDEFTELTSGFIPPDTMGSVGPNHFVEILNGAVAVYTKLGEPISLVTLNSFFTILAGNYPHGNTFDPRILYDKQSGHWFACALETNSGSNNNLLLAVSRTDNPTGLWDKYALLIGQPNIFSDYDTLGIDTNGVYFGINFFGQNIVAQLFATDIASLISPTPSLSTVYASPPYADMFSIQPPHNFDSIGPNDPAWLVCSSITANGNVDYRTLTWSNGVPTFSVPLLTVITPPYGGNLTGAPQLGGPDLIDTGDDRLMMSVIRNNRLWTARDVSVNRAGTATNPDRTAAEFIELDVSTTTATLVQSGRVFDNAATNFRFYYYPSLMVNAVCDVVMGFSGSSLNEFAGIFVCGRSSRDPIGTMGPITQLQPGLAYYSRLDLNGSNRWGDYSYTSLDPVDDLTFWTIQEYAEIPSPTNGSIWGTSISRITLPSHHNGKICGSTAVCKGRNCGKLFLSKEIGTIVRWEFSTNDGLSWSPIANTTNILHYKNLTKTTKFRVVINTNPCLAFSSVATVKVKNCLPHCKRS